MFLRQKQSGFTIVELLIVIVVIAILAAISVTAYNGIQKRARNNAKISAATSIAKVVDAYTVATGTLLATNSCLPTGNSDLNADGLGDCANITDNNAPSRTENAVVNAKLLDEKITMTFPQDVVTSSNGDKFRGLLYTYGAGNRGMSGTLQPYFLYFFLEGIDEDCKSSYSVKNDTSNPDPLYWIVPGKNYGSNGGGYTVCAYTVKHPSSI